jgi:PAS domain S-box-containing protein
VVGVDLTAALLDQVRVAVIAVDLDGKVTHWNREAEQLFGWAGDEVIGKTSKLQGVSPQAQAQAEEIGRMVLAGKSWTGDFVVGTRSGEQRRVHYHAGPVRDADGGVIGLCAVASDAEEMAETATQLSLFQAIVGQSPVGVGVYDSECRYVRANPALLDIIGRSADEVLGHTVEDVLGDLGKQVAPFIQRVLATGDPVINRELRGRTPGVVGDEDRWYQVSYFRLTDHDDNVVGAASLVSDVTDQREVRERLREATERLALLAQVSELLAASLEFDRTLSAFASLVVPAFADHCVIDLLDEEGELRRLAVVHAPSVEPEGTPWAAPGDVVNYPPSHPATIALTTDTALIVTGDPASYDFEAVAPSAESAAFARRVGLRSAIACPLSARGQTLGVVSFGSSVSGRRFGEEDRRLAEELAIRAGVAIDNARLFAREQQVAVTLQRSLLPGSITGADSLDVAAAYLPAGERDVGGDWYDVIPLSCGRVAIVIGDVMGRGVRAAALMGQLRAAIRGYAVQDLPPIDVMTYLDDFVGGLVESAIVTCVYAVYDPVDHRVCLASAGHVPPLLVPADGPATVLDELAGVALGAGTTMHSQTEVALRPGDGLVLYTDGLVERRGEDIDEGIARLADVMTPLPASLEDACDEAVAAMGRDDGHDDDVAVLVVRAANAEYDVATHRFRPQADAVSGMRVFTTKTLAEWALPEELIETAELIVSELATNVVRYAALDARSEPTMRLLRNKAELFVAVTDWNGTLPHRRDAQADEETGRGLALVEALADRWGARPIAGGGKVVWCALPIPD